MDRREGDDQRLHGGELTHAYLQTAPTLDDSFFQPMAAGVAIAAGAAPTVLALLMASPPTLIPLARYLRWQIVGTTTWDATFRIAIAANSPGM